MRLNEWMNKWVELSQWHDVFKAFLADFRDKKKRVPYGQTDGGTEGPTDGQTIL